MYDMSGRRVSAAECSFQRLLADLNKQRAGWERRASVTSAAEPNGERR